MYEATRSSPGGPFGDAHVSKPTVLFCMKQLDGKVMFTVNIYSKYYPCVAGPET